MVKHMTIKNYLLIAATGLGMLGVAAVNTQTLAQNSAPAKPAAASNAKAAAITVASVRRQSISNTIAATGTIVPWQEASVASRTNGQPITQLLADVGASVRKGQVLAQMDDRTARAELAQVQASLAQAVASAKQATLNRDRALALKGTNAISEQDILQATTQADLTAAQQSQAQANVQAAQVRLENTRVVAPDSGVIVSRNATLGQAPGAGVELFKMHRQGKLEWRAEVAVDRLPELNAGDKVSVVLGDGTAIQGSIRLVAPQLDARSRIGIVFVQLPASNKLRAEMTASGSIQRGEQSALVVPSESVVIRDGRSYVFVVNAGKVKRVAVTTGKRSDSGVELRSGVAEAAQVAVRGAGFLSDGDAVTVVAAGETAK
jgi:HlyD family secretion protein